MSNVTKQVDRGIHGLERRQVFTESDGGTGDIFMVLSSLGRPAKKVFIEATDALTFKFNVYQEIAPKRKLGEGFHEYGYDNISRSTTVKNSGVASISLEAGEDFEDSGPIKDIEIVSASGAFTITVS